MSTAVTNAVKRSDIAEQLVKNLNSAILYDDFKFKILAMFKLF